jgi:hypothetical protein
MKLVQKHPAVCIENIEIQEQSLATSSMQYVEIRANM